MTMESEQRLSSSDSTIVGIVENIRKSASDSWNYRGLELSNEMLVLLISHPNIDKAAAALDYPDENEYSKLIVGNGGCSNAFTSDDHTNFNFDINPSLLADALDIFAQFFISPLFAASSIDRELEAVDSEYETNLFKDTWRISQLEKSTSDPKHPYSGFSIGNRESLRIIPKQRGIDIQQVLLDFHKTEYSSNRMSLAVLGNQSLDELQSLVIKSFKEVQNKKLEKPKYFSDPYGESKRKTICYHVPVNESRQLTINWVIPDQRELYYCKPESYLSHLIGHQGDGSLSSYLKTLGLAIELVAGESNSAPGFNFFSISIQLTIEGLSQWERILYSVYQYLAMLRKEGSKEWIFNEGKNINQMEFQFEEKGQVRYIVSNLAGRMRDYPLSECLSGPYEMRDFRPDLINELLNEYLIPSKMRVFLTSKEFLSIAREKEKWYGTQYKQEYLSEELIKQCETCEINRELYLPIPNKFIPTDFQLFSKEKNLIRPQIPTKIKENEYYRLYYTEDSFYRFPKAYIYFEFRNPLVYVDPIHANLTTLYVELINDSLAEFVYPAQLGGLDYELYDCNDSIQLSISGFNHKIKELLNIIIDHMINIKIEVEQFEIIKEKFKQSLQFFRRCVPSTMAKFGLTYLTAEYDWNNNELLSCLDDITMHDVESFITRVLKRFYIDSLMYGNLTKNQAIEYMTLVEQKFQEKSFYQPFFPSMWFNQRELILPDGCNYAYTMFNDAYKLNSIIIYLQCFQETLENNALLGLFSYLVKQPCFNQLRTKEQLGYIINSQLWRSCGVQGFSVTVQSARELGYINQRIELFIDSIRDYIMTMSDELFKKQREGYIVKKVEIPKNMHDQGNQFWNEIISHQFYFDRPPLETEIIKTLERDDLLRFYDHYISPRSIYRRKLSVHVNPSSFALQMQTNETNTVENKDELTDIIHEESSSIINEEDIAVTTETSHETIQSTEQPPIIDKLTETENILVKQEIDLPEFEWIDNVHIWKSKLLCYPLAQSYEKLDVPVLYKL
ncbi:unnamed protein product [Rotaria sordida]|uniref:Uncharacterized protein n=2 Tax=Rotaria sordida TaxID=392033 RepID=A0A813V4C6_9BILA|nr:unnamed protein product [Rotaria sordida]